MTFHTYSRNIFSKHHQMIMININTTQRPERSSIVVAPMTEFSRTSNT